MTERNSTQIKHNPSHAELNWPGAVIAGAFQTGVLGARSLQRRFVKTRMIDCDSAMPGFRSVYGPAELCPDPDTDSEAWLGFMLDLADRIGHNAVLISSSDRYVTAVARHYDQLVDRFLLSPTTVLQGQLADKFTQYRLAQQHSMPMPLTRLVDSESGVLEFCRETRMPCLLKPNHFREWERFPNDHPLYHQKIAIAQNEEELLEHYRMASVVNRHVVLQEIIVGPDTNKRVYCSCYDREGQRIANAMFRELRCDPVGFGPATVSEPVSDPLADRICDSFLQSIGYVGICEIEMKWDERDGLPKLIEANPRLSGGGDAAPYAGVDTCWLHYLDLIGQKVLPEKPVRTDFRHIMFRPDGRAIPAYRRAGLLSWRDLLHSYRPPLAFYDLDWRDLRYSLESVLIAIRLFIREIFQPQVRG